MFKLDKIKCVCGKINWISNLTPKENSNNIVLFPKKQQENNLKLKKTLDKINIFHGKLCWKFVDTSIVNKFCLWQNLLYFFCNTLKNVKKLKSFCFHKWHLCAKNPLLILIYFYIFCHFLKIIPWNYMLADCPCQHRMSQVSYFVTVTNILKLTIHITRPYNQPRFSIPLLFLSFFPQDIKTWYTYEIESLRIYIGYHIILDQSKIATGLLLSVITNIRFGPLQLLNVNYLCNGDWF